MKGTFGFVVGVIACISAVALAVSEKAGCSKKDVFNPFRFCQLGDIQLGFGLDGWQNDTHRMHLAAQQVNAQDFDFCIAVGDLTNDRFDYEIRAFQDTFPEFKTKVHLLPGNHDINDVATLKQFKLDYNVSDHTAFSHNGYRFILLDSVTLMSNLTEFEPYTRAEWVWFEHELKSAAKRGEEIILAHHHLPFEFTEDEPDAYWTFPNRIRGKYLELVKNYGVHHILVGHRHETKNIYASDNSFTIYVVAGTARFFDDNGFGINYFDVSSCDSATDVSQEYVHLQGAGLMKRSEGLPNGCPDIFAH
ncbi:Metallo-dependent phosphatase-like protein [Lipomyces tetrasporus]|uniref:Metallo-dependent phosphatase-like protein n=1 Tax=Lipomyces tetrasporus TaxID=54092 RepID=A0AAD7QRT2_9ASCO|nr:Metallo-dependent phosphatase-like protein [Lipomyces tetrasporus]KAJ8100143.1 Metallo-dependent phosphatase-like protein [Lipomyces tetrasporus]